MSEQDILFCGIVRSSRIEECRCSTGAGTISSRASAVSIVLKHNNDYVQSVSQTGGFDGGRWHTLASFFFSPKQSLSRFASLPLHENREKLSVFLRAASAGVGSAPSLPFSPASAFTVPHPQLRDEEPGGYWVVWRWSSQCTAVSALRARGRCSRLSACVEF